MNRALLIAAATGAVLLNATGAAQAAPGDCQILAGQPVCEPFDAPAEPPQYSICTPIEVPAEYGSLGRKSCQVYDRATDAPVGAPQIFVYPPAGGALTPPPVPVDRPATAATPAATRPAVPVASAPARVVPAAPAVVAPASTPAVEEPLVAPTPAAAPAAPVAEPINNAGSDKPPTLADKIDSWVPWAAVVSCAVLLMCLARRKSS